MHKLAAIVWTLFALPQTALASGPDLFGLGARGVARAGAVISDTRGFEAVYYNPAGLGFEQSPTVALGWSTAGFSLVDNGEERDVNDAPALTIGFSVPLPFGGVLSERLAIGLGFVLPQRSILNASIAAPGERWWPLLESRAQTVSVFAALGVRLTDWLSVGVGVLALAELDGRIAVSPSDAGTLTTQVRDELFADYALIAGVTARPTHWLSVAAVYRGASEARFVLPLDADLGDAFSIPLPVLDIRGTAQFDPAEISAEVSVSVTAELRLAANLTWQDWSGYRNPINYLAVPEDFPDQPPADFHDTYSPRISAEYRLRLGPDWTLTPRLGWALEPSPTPTQDGFHNYLDTDRHLVTAGLELQWATVRLALAGQLHRSSTRAAIKDDGTRLSYQANLWVFGAELGVEL